MSDDGVVSPEPLRADDPAVGQPRAPKPLTGDWPAQLTDIVVDLVAMVRDRAVSPIQMVARMVVYGLFIVPLAITSVVLILISLIRVLDIIVPGEVWSAYLVASIILSVPGLVLWSKRKPATA